MNQPILGAIFDLDGTLVDSRVDFDAIRAELGMPARQPILEAMQQMDAAERTRCQRILERHEQAGARRAALMPGAAQFVRLLRGREIRCAVVTRNSRKMAEQVLSRLGLQIEPLIAREDGPVKPDPWAVCRICAMWRVPVDRVVMIGDYRFDIECGNRAGCRTVLFSRGRCDPQLDIEQADFVLESFTAAAELISWLGL